LITAEIVDWIDDTIFAGSSLSWPRQQFSNRPEYVKISDEKSSVDMKNPVPEAVGEFEILPMVHEAEHS